MADYTTEIQGNKNKVDNSQKTINKKKTSKISLAIAGAVVVVAIVAVAALLGGGGGSGSGGQSALIGGVWLAENDGRAPRGFPDSIEFFSDGTCIFDLYSDAGNASFSIDGKRLKVAILWEAFTYDFDVKGNSLTLRDDSGDTVVYERTR